LQTALEAGEVSGMEINAVLLLEHLGEGFRSLAQNKDPVEQ